MRPRIGIAIRDGNFQWASPPRGGRRHPRQGESEQERKVIFSINDLDETLPAPWEWDVKRLAASFVVACRDHGLSEAAARDADPLFLQVKEARASVLEPYAGPSVFPNHGQRVVDGYRRMQPASDMFPGWSRGPKRDFFIRQLRDMKIGPMVETFGQAEMGIYAGWCGKALALSHARSGNSAMIRGYMGKSDVLDTALAAFSKAYADQNERDHGALDRAIRKGKVKAILEDAR